MKKRILSYLLAAALLLCACWPAAAATGDGNIAQPYYNNTDSSKVTFTISSNGTATVSLRCVGVSGVTTSIEAVTRIERQLLTNVWTKVDIGTENKEWVDSTSSYRLLASHSVKLSQTGTYRAVTTFTIRGTGGSPDVIVHRVTATY